MKKIISFILCIFLSTVLMAQANLIIKGVVPSILDLQMIEYTEASNLNLMDSITNLKIADFIEKTNNRTGYSITISSLNASTGSNLFLKGLDVSNADTLEYTLKYDSNVLEFNNGTALAKNYLSKTSKNGLTSSLTISYVGSFLNADTYQDMLSIAIIKN